MTPQEFRSVLKQTLDDQALTRTERRALKSVLDDIQPAETQLDLYRHEAFDLAREALASTRAQGAVIEWLEGVVRLLKPAIEEGHTVASEAHFSPGDQCRNRIQSLFRQSRSSVDICIFTITDDEIAEIIAEAHNRGVKIRLISDDDKANDIGSDIDRYHRAMS